MVYTIPTLDIGGDIGKGLGQFGAGVAENLYIKSGIEKSLQDLKNADSRTAADLSAILNKNLGLSSRGMAKAQQLLPSYLESAKQLPAPGAQQPQGGQPSPLSDSLAFRGYQPESGGGVPSTGQGTLPVSSKGTLPPESSQIPGKSQQNAPIKGLGLLQNPEVTDITDRQQLRDYYSAPPVINPEAAAMRAQQLLSSGQAANFDEANARVNAEFDREVAKFEQSKANFEKGEQRINDTLAAFEPEFNAMMGDKQDPVMKGMGRKIAEKYATETNADGTPKYTPRIAAQKAIQESQKINNKIKDLLSLGEKSFTEAFAPSQKKKRIELMKPTIRQIQRLGIEQYARDEMIANDILSPGEASALLYPTSKQTLSAYDKIPQLRKDVETMFSTERMPEANFEKLRPQALQQAAEIILNADENESLVTIRALLEDKGFDQTDFNDAYDLAVEQGFVPSRLQEDESGLLQRPVKWSLADLWLGRPKSMKLFIRNYLGQETN